MILLGVGANAAAPLPEDTFSLSCRAAVLMERQTGTVLYARGEHEHLSPASVTKVMTLLLVAEAVEDGSVSPDDIVTGGARAASMGGSQIWLREGEQMTVSEMVKCVAVVSANDCAVALAEHLCGSEEAFVSRMNARAAELGCTDTHFTNCTGLFESAEHYTSAMDVAILSRALLGHEFIRQFTSIWTDTIRGGEFGLTNTNKLVHSYSGCTGLKTGFTTSAMFCLSASAERDGTEYIAVILHGDTSALRFDAARTLLDYAFANYALYTPAPEGELPAVPVTLGESDSVPVECAGGGAVVLEKGRLGDVEQSISLPESVSAPVEAGQELGTLTLTLDGEPIAELPLVAKESVSRLRWADIWLGLLRGFAGERKSEISETVA